MKSIVVYLHVTGNKEQQLEMVEKFKKDAASFLSEFNYLVVPTTSETRVVYLG